MANRIQKVLTRYANREDRKVPIMMMDLDVDDLDAVGAFMSEVAAAFRDQRMISPKETHAMFVTLRGVLTAEEFKRRWARQAARDPVVGFIMERMESASVLHGARDGTVIDHISLIDRGFPPASGRRHSSRTDAIGTGDARGRTRAAHR